MLRAKLHGMLANYAGKVKWGHNHIVAMHLDLLDLYQKSGVYVSDTFRVWIGLQNRDSTNRLVVFNTSTSIYSLYIFFLMPKMYIIKCRMILEQKEERKKFKIRFSTTRLIFNTVGAHSSVFHTFFFVTKCSYWQGKKFRHYARGEFFVSMSCTSELSQSTATWWIQEKLV